MQRSLKRLSVVLLCFSFLHAFAYSVESHEEVIDLTWESDIHPALLQRYPGATAEELRRAHAYAYGGSVIEDIGYYPLANQKFTNLLHYVRSGDFIAALIRESRNIDEYAFALGALSHYAADSWGHMSINESVPREYPKLRAKYGDCVTYEDNRSAHLDTEFSFDVLEVAKQRYNAQQYHRQIGFEVPEDLLERAFGDTYGIALDDFLNYDDLTIEIFRITAKTILPEGIEVAIASRKQRMGKEKDDLARQQFLSYVDHADYQKEFRGHYRRPGPFASVLGFVLKLIPFGPAKVLGYRNPTPITEDLYFRSMDNVIGEYRRLLQQVNAGDLNFPNRNLDTGDLSHEGQYRLADQSYAGLVRRLQRGHFRHIDAAVRANLLGYFAQGDPQNGSIKPKDWQKTEAALQELRDLTTVPAAVRSSAMNTDHVR